MSKKLLIGILLLIIAELANTWLLIYDGHTFFNYHYNWDVGHVQFATQALINIIWFLSMPVLMLMYFAYVGAFIELSDKGYFK